jgi:hypothetical protein
VELLRVHDYPIDNVMALKLASRPNTPGRIWKAQTLRRSFLPHFQTLSIPFNSDLHARKPSHLIV